MSTATTTNPQQRRQSGLYLRCNVCNRTYTKKEHLQRHELSHTGAKPFACQTCGRSFARQDALNRHMKLHQRRGTETSSTISDATSLTPQDSIDSQNQYQLQSGEMLISPLTTNNAFTQPQMNATTLFWPDSEDLLQNIMSIDPALWEQPMSLIPSALASHASPDLLFVPNASSTAGDEGHRAIQTLSAQLSSTLSGVTAPAALSDLTSRFLDSCLHMFFSTFVPMLPVIHRPTFVFRECSPPLLLNAIAIGSLFLGTKEASAKGDALWRLAHTAVATSWHSMINYRGEFDVVSGLQLVQTSLLSQVHAALARSRTLRMTSQVFHGLGFYWARYCGLFDLPVTTIPSSNDTPEVKYEAWRIWVARESQLRTLLGLYILDGVISQYSGNPTHAQHMSNQLPMPSSEAAYTASDPDEWLQRLAEGTPPPAQLRFCDIFRLFFYSGNDISQSVPSDLSFFALKVVLEGLKSLVAESKRIEPRPVGLPQQAEINHVLDRVRQYILAHPRLTMVEKRTAMLRWHAIGLDALMITARGARRLCFAHGITQNIFGGRERFETDINAERHIDKDDARRTLLHAREIHRISSQLPLGLAHDPHIPGAVFAAVTTYAAFALAGRLRIIFPDVVDWRAVVLFPSADGSSPGTSNGPEYSQDMDNTTTAFIRGKLDANGMVLNTTMIDLSYEMSSIRLLLRGLSLQWGVCTEMEEVVDAWIAKCT